MNAKYGAGMCGRKSASPKRCRSDRNTSCAAASVTVESGRTSSPILACWHISSIAEPTKVAAARQDSPGHNRCIPTQFPINPISPATNFVAPRARLRNRAAVDRLGILERSSPAGTRYGNVWKIRATNGYTAEHSTTTGDWLGADGSFWPPKNPSERST